MNSFQLTVEVLLLLTICSYNSITCQNLPPSPCPNLFTYKFNGNSYYGLIEVPSPALGETLTLKVELSLRAQLPGDVGSLEPAYPKQVALQKIFNGEPTMQYRVRFPLLRPLPRLTLITYNSQTICYGPPEPGHPSKIQLEYRLFTVTGDQPIPTNNFNKLPHPDFVGGQKNPPNYQLNSNVLSYQTTNNNFDDNGYLVNVISHDLPLHGGNGVPQIVNYHPPQTQSSSPQWQQPQTQTQPQQPQVQIQQEQPQQYESPQTQPQPPSPTQQQFIHNTEKEPINTGNTLINNEPDEQICGVPDSGFSVTALIVGGEPIKRGSWPWLVGVYKTDVSTLSFQCGGNLISKRIVVTAAHCINIGSKVYKANEIVTYLGQFNISPGVEHQDGSEIKQTALVTPHPDFMVGNKKSFDADIAVIVMKTEATYNQYIRPICLWQGTNDLRKIEGMMGSVVGWGRDANGNVVTPEPQRKEVPIVPDITCLRSSETFRQITSNRTFCAGARDGTGPCSGDSGGGLALKNNNRWALRGIVSVAALDPISNQCNLNEYVVFTDATKFTPWIMSFMNF